MAYKLESVKTKVESELIPVKVDGYSIAIDERTLLTFIEEDYEKLRTKVIEYLEEEGTCYNDRIELKGIDDVVYISGIGDDGTTHKIFNGTYAYFVSSNDLKEMFMID